MSDKQDSLDTGLNEVVSISATLKTYPPQFGKKVNHILETIKFIDSTVFFCGCLILYNPTLGQPSQVT